LRRCLEDLTAKEWHRMHTATLRHDAQRAASGSRPAAFLSAYPTKHSVEPVDPLLACLAQGEAHYRAGQYEQADRLFAAAVERARGTHPGDLRLAVSLHDLAESRRMLGRYMEAEQFCREALELREAALGAGHPYVARTLMNLALLRAVQWDSEGALRLCLRARDALEAGVGTGHPDYASNLLLAARVLADAGELERSEALAQAAYEVWLVTLAADEPDWAHAGDLVRRALAVTTERLGTEHAAVADVWSGAVEIHAAAGEPAQAVRCCEQAMAIRRSVFGEAHPEIAAGLNRLGELHRQAGRFDEAMACYTSALAVAEATLGEGPDAAVILNNMAIVCACERRPGEALRRLRRAHEIEVAYFGERDPRLGPTLQNMARLYAAFGKRQAAMRVLRKVEALERPAELVWE
jgi:tetratricopeptide (TPR) repeat protein